MKLKYALLISLMLSPYASNAKSIASEVFQKSSPSVVSVKTPSRSGSGVAVRTIDNGSIIATNCHVLKDETQYIVRIVGIDRDITATRVGGDEQKDLCLLLVKVQIPEARIRNVRDLAVGEDVFAIGSPRGFSATISQGIVSQLRTSDGSVVIQTSAAISPGSSGGGLFDEKGRLVGITSFTRNDSQNLNFAMAASDIYDVAIASIKSPPSSATTSQPKHEKEKVIDLGEIKNGNKVYVASLRPTTSGLTMNMAQDMATPKQDEQTGLPFNVSIGTLELDCTERQYLYSNEERSNGDKKIRTLQFVQPWAPFSSFISLESSFDIMCKAVNIRPVFHPKPGHVTIKSDKANVRDNYTLADSHIVAELAKGERLVTMGYISDSYKVVYHGEEYYLSKRVVTFSE